MPVILCHEQGSGKTFPRSFRGVLQGMIEEIFEIKTLGRRDAFLG